jgi:hypothetical protein
MAEGVIDLLEAGRPVQVNQKETRLGACARRAGQHFAAALGEQLAIQQAGQLVVIGLMVLLHGLRGAEVHGCQREGKERDDEGRFRLHSQHDEQRRREEDQVHGRLERQLGTDHRLQRRASEHGDRAHDQEEVNDEIGQAGH